MNWSKHRHPIFVTYSTAATFCGACTRDAAIYEGSVWTRARQTTIGNRIVDIFRFFFFTFAGRQIIMRNFTYLLGNGNTILAFSYEMISDSEIDNNRRSNLRHWPPKYWYFFSLKPKIDAMVRTFFFLLLYALSDSRLFFFLSIFCSSKLFN